jgi:hypothetical protein
VPNKDDVPNPPGEFRVVEECALDDQAAHAVGDNRERVVVFEGFLRQRRAQVQRQGSEWRVGTPQPSQVDPQAA